MYNLAEFKEWLRNKDSSLVTSYQRWLTNLQEPAKWELFLKGVRFLNNDPQQYFAGQGITDLGQEWKAEVDEREREREREREHFPSYPRSNDV